MARKKRIERYARHTYPEMRQLSNGVWYIFWTNTVRESLKTRDKDLAIQVFNVRRREKRDDDLQALGPKPCPTLSTFIKEYREYRENDGCAESTIDNDVLSLSSLMAFTGDIRLSDINRRDIDLFHADLQKSKIIETKTGKQIRTKGCRRTSVNAYIRHIKHAFYKAHEWGYIEKNPYERYKPYEEPEQPFKELTDKEIREKLLPAIKENDFQAMIQMYLQVGARAGELCSAHRDWIVEIEDRNGIPKKWLIFPKTKRHQSRKVPIGEDLEAILEKLPAEGYLFPRWRKPQSVSHKIKRILRSIGRGDMWLHGLRHNTGTKISRNGYPIKVRMKLLGHKQMSTMLRYDHPDDDDIRAAAESLHFSPIMVPQDAESTDQEGCKKDAKIDKVK